MGLWKIFFLYLFNTFKASQPLKAGHKAGNFPRPNFFQKGRFSENRPCTRPAGPAARSRQNSWASPAEKIRPLEKKLGRKPATPQIIWRSAVKKMLNKFLGQFLPIIVKIRPQLGNLELGRFLGRWLPRPQEILLCHIWVQRPWIRPSGTSLAEVGMGGRMGGGGGGIISGVSGPPPWTVVAPTCACTATGAPDSTHAIAAPSVPSSFLLTSVNRNHGFLHLPFNIALKENWYL